jgi:Zn-dependent membrane protease YugP
MDTTNMHSFFSSIFALAPTGFMGIGIGYWFIMGGTMLVSWLVSSTLKRRFAQHSQNPINFTGAQIAEMMLRAHGIHDVHILQVNGQLTDHYDPINKTVNLSEPVYHINSVAAAAVAAHEVGHAVQHQQAYRWLSLRSKMVPTVNIASQIMNFVMMIGLFGAVFMRSPSMLLVLCACMAVTTLFALITLPVEFDASQRALAWMQRSGIANRMDQEGAKNALFWASMTYVVGALSSAAYLLYFLLQFLGANRDES